MLTENAAPGSVVTDDLIIKNSFRYSKFWSNSVKFRAKVNNKNKI